MKLCAIVLFILFGLLAFGQSPIVTSYESVDPFIGTSSDGNVFPGATLPFGMIQWSPDTPPRGWFRGWYKWDEHAIVGFSLTHLSGAGCPLYSDFPILPWPDDIKNNPGSAQDAYALPFSHTSSDGKAQEIAHPGYYGITFPSGMKAEFTVGMRSGIARIQFPPGAKRNLIFKNWSANSRTAGREKDGGSMAVVGNDTIVGTTHSGGFCNSASDYTLHFAAKLQQPFTSFGVWQDAGIVAGDRDAHGKTPGAFVTLASGDQPVLLKVGLSFVSQEKALANLATENPGWNFDQARSDAEHIWSEHLDRVQIEGADNAQRKTFYTALYHMLMSPNVFSDADGEYIGFDDKIRRLQGKTQYHNFSDWDTYRNVVQLHAMLYPHETSEMMQSLVRDAEQSGWLPRWPAANDVTSVMGGDSSPILLSSAYAFGARDFDTRAALSFMIKAATQSGTGKNGYIERPNGAEFRSLGFIPSEENQDSVSIALEYASSDFAIAQFAKSLGDMKMHGQLMMSAQNWRNNFDQETRFVRPRLRNGTFLPGFDADKVLPQKDPPAQDMHDQQGFQEGNSWQYSWMVPHNYAGVFQAMGGMDKVIPRLDRFFTQLKAWHQPFFNIGNEPSIATPYAYSFGGQAWQTQEVIDRIRREMFALGPLGLPGNDDLGATSGWYVWNAMGLYPVIPGIGGVAVGTPQFSRVTIRMASDRTLQIKARGEGVFVQSLSLNGKPFDRAWLPLSALRSGNNVLEFSMSNTPKKTWASAPEARPPSFREGEASSNAKASKSRRLSR